jgi:hypothetical protein
LLVVTLTNHGRTAAEITRTFLTAVSVLQLDRTPRTPIGPDGDSRTFGQVVSHRESVPLSLDLTLNNDVVDAIRSSRKHLGVHGYIAYRDFLDRHWRKGFIGVLDGTSMKWYPVDGHAGGAFEQPPASAGVHAYTYTIPDEAGEAREAAR